MERSRRLLVLIACTMALWLMLSALHDTLLDSPPTRKFRRNAPLEGSDPHENPHSDHLHPSSLWLGRQAKQRSRPHDEQIPPPLHQGDAPTGRFWNTDPRDLHQGLPRERFHAEEQHSKNRRLPSPPEDRMPYSHEMRLPHPTEGEQQRPGEWRLPHPSGRVSRYPDNESRHYSAADRHVNGLERNKHLLQQEGQPEVFRKPKQGDHLDGPRLGSLPLAPKTDEDSLIHSHVLKRDEDSETQSRGFENSKTPSTDVADSKTPSTDVADSKTTSTHPEDSRTLPKPDVKEGKAVKHGIKPLATGSLTRNIPNEISMKSMKGSKAMPAKQESSPEALAALLFLRQLASLGRVHGYQEKLPWKQPMTTKASILGLPRGNSLTENNERDTVSETMSATKENLDEAFSLAMLALANIVSNMQGSRSSTNLESENVTPKYKESTTPPVYFNIAKQTLDKKGQKYSKYRMNVYDTKSRQSERKSNTFLSGSNTIDSKSDTSDSGVMVATTNAIIGDMKSKILDSQRSVIVHDSLNLQNETITADTKSSSTAKKSDLVKNVSEELGTNLNKMASEQINVGLDSIDADTDSDTLDVDTESAETVNVDKEADNSVNKAADNIHVGSDTVTVETDLPKVSKEYMDMNNGPSNTAKVSVPSVIDPKIKEETNSDGHDPYKSSDFEDVEQTSGGKIDTLIKPEDPLAYIERIAFSRLRDDNGDTPINEEKYLFQNRKIENDSLTIEDSIVASDNDGSSKSTVSLDPVIEPKNTPEPVNSVNENQGLSEVVSTLVDSQEESSGLGEEDVEGLGARKEVIPGMLEVTGEVMDNPISDRKNQEEFNSILQTAANATREVMLVFFDGGYFDIALNFAKLSVKKNELTNVVFVSLDSSGCEQLRALGMWCFLTSYNNEKVEGSVASAYGEDEYWMKVNARHIYILEALLRGYTVMHVDPDVFLFSDPFIHLHNSSADIQGMLDGESTMNIGCIYVKPTRHALGFFSDFVRLIRHSPTLNEQGVFNMLLGLIAGKSESFDFQYADPAMFLNGQTYYDQAKRYFYGDKPPCEKCVAVHNNHIIGRAGKIYRFKENMQWAVDNGKYYSDAERKYLMYNNPAVFDNPERSLKYEIAALRDALAMAAILNRTLILPRFHCEGKSLCPLNSHLLLDDFDKGFGGQYRENVFLRNPLVPNSVKQSESKLFHLNTRALLGIDLQLPEGTPVLFSQKPGSLSAAELKHWFGSAPESILRLHSLYGAYVDFGNPDTEAAFNDRIMKAFKRGTYEQNPL